MKLRKYFIPALLSPLMLVGCADWDNWSYDVEKPSTIAGYEYLNDYAPLKENLNRDANGSFQLGAGVSESEFISGGPLLRLAAHNFDEVVAGNAMKMVSCVNNETGDMDFGTVSAFLKAAEDAGVSVYGHTLAWHAQQPVKWLNKLIKDKELDVDPDAKMETLMTSYSYEDAPDGPFPHYPMGCEPPIINGALHYEPNGSWNQFFIFPGGSNSLTEGDYLARLYMTADQASDGLQITFQNGWGGDAQNISLNFSAKEGDQVYEFNLPQIVGGNYDVILKPQTANVTLDVKKIEVYKLESPALEIEKEIYVQTYQDGPFPYYVMGVAPPVINGAIHYESDGNWNQFFCVPGGDNPLVEGDYVIYVDIDANQAASGVQLTIQNGWGGDADNITVAIPIKAGRQKYMLKYPGVKGGNYDCILKPQTADVNLDLYSVTICQVVKMNSIPLTPEEKKDTLTWAMDRWIKGMMETCDGRVKAWDVVNEAISGGDADGEGVYALQHGKEGDTDNFFWQDYLGDLDYVRTAVKLAREYGPSDIKLFVNDYNLEYEWHGNDNKKLQSLIKWIERWEADGVTKIDGIGTQTHISFQADATKQKKQEDLIVDSFKKMAATGKLVRVSELDMGYVDAGGNTIKTDQMTEAMHKQMAEFYKFIIKAYFENIPASQQWGICQWCITDAPASSGWRPGEPVGLWDLNYSRKHTYAGFADGLSGK
jgi:GH35 family endo-1,4-beta-xylanase